MSVCTQQMHDGLACIGVASTSDMNNGLWQT